MRLTAVAPSLLAMIASTAWANGPTDEFYDKMDRVFVGPHTREQIVAGIEHELALYGKPETSENIGHFGSVLVALRRSNGIPKMQVLSCLVQMGKIGNDYEGDAGLCSAGIETGMIKP